MSSSIVGWHNEKIANAKNQYKQFFYTGTVTLNISLSVCSMYAQRCAVNILKIWSSEEIIRYESSLIFFEPIPLPGYFSLSCARPFAEYVLFCSHFLSIDVYFPNQWLDTWVQRWYEDKLDFIRSISRIDFDNTEKNAHMFHIYKKKKSRIIWRTEMELPIRVIPWKRIIKCQLIIYFLRNQTVF